MSQQQENLTTAPFGGILLAAAQVQARELEDLRGKLVRQEVAIAGLRRQLENARRRQSLWLIRQHAWRRERDDLCRQLASLREMQHA